MIKKKVQNWVVALLLFSMAISITTPAFGEEDTTKKFKSDKLNSLSFVENVQVARPFGQTVGLDCAIGKEDGVNVMYTTSSAKPAIFNVYDLDNFKVLQSFELAGVASSWEHNIDKNGNVYIIGTDKAKLFRYSPKTKEIEDLGSIDGQSAAYQSAFDDEGNLYIGTYPAGSVVKFDPKTKKFTSLGQAYSGHPYVRSLVMYKGYLYAGTMGDTDAVMVKIDPKTGNKQAISVPIQEKYFKEVSNIYGQTIFGQYGLIYSAAGKGNNVWMVFDYENNKWTDIVILKAAGTYGSPVKNGKIYFGADGVLKSMDAKTLEIQDTAIKSSFNGRKFGWVDLQRDDDFNGNILVTIAYSGSPIFVNIEKGAIRTMTEAKLKGGYISLQHVTTDDQDNVYMGGYMGTDAAKYNIETGEMAYMPMGQTETIKQIGDKIYFGTYAAGEGEVYDPSLPIEKKVNPKRILKIENEQDRPYIVDGEGDYIVFGSVATYGKLGGALTIYNKNTGEYEVFRNIVQNQSIVGVAVKDGLVYGSTTTSGGLGIEYPEKEAKMFVWDIKKKQKIKEWTLEYPAEVTKTGPVKIIGDLEVGPDGLIWGATQGYVFAMEPVTCKIVKSAVVGDFNYSGTGHFWMPRFLRFHSNGLLYLSIDYGVILDPETMEFISLRPYSKNKSNIMDIDSEGNVYYGLTSTLRKVAVTTKPVSKEEQKEIYNKLKDTVTLKVNKHNAISYGDLQQIDDKNTTVRPIIKDGRTLLPVRFVAESLKADVSWNAQTRTAVLKLGEKEINIPVDENQIIINGQAKEIDVPAQIIKDRTMLPIRALAEAVGKEVFWDNSGLIIISDQKDILDNEKDAKFIDKINEFLKNYAPRDYELKMEEANRQAEIAMEEAILGQKEVVNIENADFEEGELGEVIPGWEKIAKTVEGLRFEVSDKRSYKGEKSFYLEDQQTALTYGIMSQPVRVAKDGKYVLKTKLFIEEGRTSVSLRFYDENLNQVGTVSENIQTGQGAWQDVTIYANAPEGSKYARIILSCSNLWITKAYYDNVVLYKDN